LNPDVSSASKFADDEFLLPVLEDDALLFSLDDLRQDVPETLETEVKQTPEARAAELETELKALQAQFADFRVQVDQTLERRWIDTEATNTDSSKKVRDIEGDYFDSYSYNGDFPFRQSTLLHR
jgi:protein arginine N-methyltransferase 3